MLDPNQNPIVSRATALAAVVMLCFTTTTASAFSACDFNLDGRCQTSDLELLQSAAGTAEVLFDLNTSGMVDNGDITMWLTMASDEDPDGRVFRRGDVDLDGTVTAWDLAPLIFNFGQPGMWSDGNFDTDEIVGGSDFTMFAFQFAQDSSNNAPTVVAVPEPELAGVFGLFVCLALWRRNRE